MSIPLLGAGRGGGGGFSLYVDSVNGDDGANGLTEDTALQTLTAAETAALAYGNGVRVGLRYGSEWRDRLQLRTLTNVVVGAYGDRSDGLPVVRCDDVLSGGWADSTDRADANTNVYSQSVSWSGANALWLACWEDGARLNWASSLANCQSTPGSFYIATGNALSAASNSPQTLYIHPRGSTNAKSDGKVYEWASRDCAIGVGDDSTVRRVWAQRSPGASGGIVGGKRCLAEDCIGSGGVVHDILLASGVQRRCIGWIEHIDSRVTPLSLEFFTSDGTGLSGRWENCVVVSVGGGNSFGGHTNASTFYDAWELVGCSAKDAAIGGTDLISLTIERPYLINSGISVNPNGAGGSCVVTDPWIVRNNSATRGRIQPNGSNPFTIDGMRAFTSAGDDRLIGHTAGSNLLTLTRSVLVDDADATIRRQLVWIGGASQSAVIDGVIFVGSGANAFTMENRAFWNNGGTLTSGDNVFNPNTNFNCNVRLGGTEYNTPAAYLAAVQPGSEIGSVVADPQLVDPANGNFTAQASGLPAAGLERDPTCQNYTPIPASLAAAEAWILGL